MELILSLACEQAQTRPDGKLDVQGIFNALAAPGFPATQERMMVVFVVEWKEGEAGRKALKADLLDPDGKPVLTIQGHTDVKPAVDGGGPSHTRLIMPVENIVFPAAGRYRFRLQAGEDSSEAFSLFLNEQPEDEEAKEVEQTS